MKKKYILTKHDYRGSLISNTSIVGNYCEILKSVTDCFGDTENFFTKALSDKVNEVDFSKYENSDIQNLVKFLNENSLKGVVFEYSIL